MGKTKELFEDMRQTLESIKNQVIEGEISAFLSGREIRILESDVKQFKEDTADAEKVEFALYSKKELAEMKIQMSGGGYTYDYKHIPEWVEQKKKLTEIEEKAKVAFKLQVSSTIEVDKETGEIINEIDFTPAKATAKKQSVSFKK